MIDTCKNKLIVGNVILVGDDFLDEMYKTFGKSKEDIKKKRNQVWDNASEVLVKGMKGKIGFESMKNSEGFNEFLNSQAIIQGCFVLNNIHKFDKRIPNQFMVTEIHKDYICIDFLPSTLKKAWARDSGADKLIAFVRGLKLNPERAKYYKLCHAG